MKHKVEAFDIWHYVCGANYNYAPLIRFRIYLRGCVDAEILKKAVTLSLDTAPLLGCVFDATAKRPRWIERGFSGGDIVSLVEGDVVTDCQIDKYQSVDIDISSEPQLKIIIARKNNCDTICIAINHMICDGVGYKQYLYLLCDIYTRLINGKEPPPQSFMPRGLKPLLAGIPLKERIRLLRLKKDYNAPPDNHVQRGLDDNDGAVEAYMLKRKLIEADFNALKVFLKSRNATVNDGLLALFARAFCKATGTERIHIPSTMDLRKFMKKNAKYGIGNYTCNCICSIPVAPGDTFEKTVAEVSRQMTEFKSENGILKSMLVWDLVTRLTAPAKILENFTKFMKLPTFFFTNTGIVDAELLNFNGIPVEDAYMMSPFKHRPYLQFTASTFNGCCMLSCNIYGAEGDRQFVSRLFDDICAEAAAL